MHSPNNMHETCVMGAVMIVKDMASVLTGLAQRHLEVPCVMLISQGIFEHQAMSRSTMPSVRNKYVDVSRAKLPRPFLLHTIGQCRDQHSDPRDPCSWGRSESWPQSGPSKGRGRQPLGESARAHFHLLVSFFASLTHTHSYIGSWIRVQCPVGGYLTPGCGEIGGQLDQ
jgi:hypothetical protein